MQGTTLRGNVMQNEIICMHAHLCTGRVVGQDSIMMLCSLKDLTRSVIVTYVVEEVMHHVAG